MAWRLFFIGLCLLSTKSVLADDSRIGTSLDLGLPDGVAGGIVYRANGHLRFELSANHNTAGYGARLGVTARAFDWRVAPTVTLEGGHLSSGDGQRLAGLLMGDSDFESPALRELSYQFANAHLGFEVGRRRATFFVRAGFALVHSKIRYAEEAINALAEEEGEPPPMVEIKGAPTLWMFAPSARIGLVLYL